MIAADAVRALAIAGLVATVRARPASRSGRFAIVAFVEGTGVAFFGTAQAGALRAVVPRRQLPDGRRRRSGPREATVTLAGPAARRRALRARPRRPVHLRRRVVRLLVRLAPRDADAVPGGARASTVATAHAGSPKASASSGTGRSCARCAFVYGLGTSSGRACCSLSSSSASARACRAVRSALLVASFGACLLLGSFASPLFRRALLDADDSAARSSGPGSAARSSSSGRTSTC